jgi:hypothetical protein
MKDSWIENPNGGNMLYCLLEIFIFGKFPNLKFWWNFKVSSFGRFEQNLLHRQQLRACLKKG